MPIRSMTFITHAEPEYVAHTMDLETPLCTPGRLQADAFAHHAGFHGDRYTVVLTSGARRTQETAQEICLILGITEPNLWIIWEMYDTCATGLGKLDLERFRREILKEFGPQPVSAYDGYARNMQDGLEMLALRSREILETHVKEALAAADPSDILVVGHPVYTNAIILELFALELTPEMEVHLRDDAPLEPCSGYRLLFGEHGEVTSMQQVSWNGAGYSCERRNPL